MGKKKKNAMFSYNGGNNKSKSNNKKDKDKKSKHSKEAQDLLSRSKPTLTKHDSAVIRAAMSRPAKLGEDASKFRRICNHQGGTVDLRELDRLGVNRSYVPFFDKMLKMFGESKIAFCDQCFDTMVAEGTISVDDAWRAVCSLYAIANYVKATIKMNKKEISALSDLQETLVKEWAGVVKMFGDSISARTKYTPYPEQGGQFRSSSNDDLGSLN